MPISDGTIVYLKSGSPAMIAQKTNVDGVTCQWFVGSSYQSAIFPEAALTQTDPTVALEHARRKAKAALEISDPIPSVDAMAAK